MRAFKGFEHGINFGGWLSQCKHTEEHYDGFIKAEDFETVKNWGLDHIRIPVDYELFLNKDRTFRGDRFRYLDFAVTECRKNGLHMILDLHRTPGYSFYMNYGEIGFFDNENDQNTFYAIWEEFAKRYGKESDLVAFELLNEVTAKEYSDNWNRIAETCIKRIRAIAPDTYILVGGYYNNSVEAVRDLLPPYDDKIVYNFHCYDPLLFTHQGAYWIQTMDRTFRCPYEMSYKEYTEKSIRMCGEHFKDAFARFNETDTIGVGYFEALFEDALKVADERNVPLYCGEYGVIDLVEPTEALKWFRDFHAVMKTYSIGSAVWSYRRMDFGISDPRMDGVRDELLTIIRHEQ